jgi:myosin heavy subunit
MPKPDELNDLDQLIDKAVDTYFVESPTTEEHRAATDNVTPDPSQAFSAGNPSASTREAPSLDEVVDTLFTKAFKGETSPVTSGDQETDWAIDLAVDTLFVEEPETPPPETAQLEVRVAESGIEDDQFIDFQEIENIAKPGISETAERNSTAPVSASLPSPAVEFSQDDAIAKEISRHMHTLFKETAQASETTTEKTEGPPKVAAVDRASRRRTPDAFPLRKLQESILTLEWEISKRSVSALASELQKVRSRFQDNVTVDFAALAMKVVLEYVVKRMSRAHPESVRFLMEVTDYLDRKLSTSEDDPLVAFHQILTRYERYKSVVRKAERLPDRQPPILRQLEVKDADAFSRLVERHATTVVKAGRSLAKRLSRSGNPENLIRSFRFLVSRSVNRILENTLREDARKRAATQRRTKHG